MKKLMIQSLVLGCAMGAAAHAQSSSDKSFVKDAAEGGMAEVQLGKLAEQKATNPDVKAFGHKMVVDHTRLNEKMKPVAEKMGVSLPSSPSMAQKAMYEDLKMKSGANFDKAYIEAMVKDHHKDLNDFTNEYNSTQYMPLKNTVGEGRTVIKQHTEMVDSLAKKMNISVPNS